MAHPELRLLAWLLLLLLGVGFESAGPPRWPAAGARLSSGLRGAARRCSKVSGSWHLGVTLQKQHTVLADPLGVVRPSSSRAEGPHCAVRGSVQPQTMQATATHGAVLRQKGLVSSLWREAVGTGADMPRRECTCLQTGTPAALARLPCHDTPCTQLVVASQADCPHDTYFAVRPPVWPVCR